MDQLLEIVTRLGLPMEPAMRVKFVMHHAGREDLAPVYERLNGCGQGGAARALKCLLSHEDTSGMPKWFEKLPRIPFSGRRATSIRMTILSPESDPTTALIYAHFESMSQSQKYDFILRKLLGLTKTKPTVEEIQPVLNQNESRTSQTSGEIASAHDSKAPLTPTQEIEGKSVAGSDAGGKNSMSRKMKSFVQSANA